MAFWLPCLPACLLACLGAQTPRLQPKWPQELKLQLIKQSIDRSINRAISHSINNLSDQLIKGIVASTWKPTPSDWTQNGLHFQSLRMVASLAGEALGALFQPLGLWLCGSFGQCFSSGQTISTGQAFSPWVFGSLGPWFSHCR